MKTTMTRPKMTQLIIAMMLALLSMTTTACGTVAPDPGYEAVLTYKPWIWGHGGVDATPVTTGRSFVAISTSATHVNMQPMLFHIQFQDLMTNDGVPLDFDATIRLRVTHSVTLVQKYGAEGWFERNLEQPIRAMTRDAVKKHGLNEMAINVSAADSVDQEITGHILELIKRDSFPAELQDFTLGRANPPDAIENQRIETAAQQQMIQTQTQMKLAQDKRSETEKARAGADNAYNNAIRAEMNLSSEQWLDLEAIKAMREICKGGGCTIVTTGALPTFGIRK